jgi:hypothetical protein
VLQHYQTKQSKQTTAERCVPAAMALVAKFDAFALDVADTTVMTGVGVVSWACVREQDAKT